MRICLTPHSLKFFIHLFFSLFSYWWHIEVLHGVWRVIGSEFGSQLWWCHQDWSNWSYKQHEVAGLTALRSLLGLHQGCLSGIDHGRGLFSSKRIFSSHKHLDITGCICYLLLLETFLFSLFLPSPLHSFFPSSQYCYDMTISFNHFFILWKFHTFI